MSSDSQPPSPEERTSEGERIVRLALHVKAHPGTTLEEIRTALPREYGAQSGNEAATRRRFERDKKTLRDYGVFIVTDDNYHYSIDAQASYAAPVDLTDAQASLLRLLCNALLDDPSYPLKNELRMILAKIGDDIDVPDLLPAMEQGGSTSGTASERPRAGLKKVRKAIAQRKRLSFDYQDAHGGKSSRAVEPFGCFLLNKNCYVVAWDPGVEDERLFRLDRMNHVRVNAKAAGKPDFPARSFDAARYYRLPFQYGTEDYTALVHFEAADAWRARRLAMGQGSFELADDGFAESGDSPLTWSVHVSDTDALTRWCIENGPGIVPVAPEKAHKAYVQGISAVLRAIDKTREAGEKQ